jgi:hypothetical protein
MTKARDAAIRAPGIAKIITGENQELVFLFSARPKDGQSQIAAKRECRDAIKMNRSLRTIQNRMPASQIMRFNRIAIHEGGGGNSDPAVRFAKSARKRVKAMPFVCLWRRIVARECESTESAKLP